MGRTGTARRIVGAGFILGIIRRISHERVAHLFRFALGSYFREPLPNFDVFPGPHFLVLKFKSHHPVFPAVSLTGGLHRHWPSRGSGRGRSFVRCRVPGGRACQLPTGKSLGTRHDIEEFFIDLSLPNTVRTAFEIGKQVVDILVGALHCRQTACILTGKRFRAGPE